jgi:hypothetical protein
VHETRCFCGCGRSAAFGQARAVNAAARELSARDGDDPLLAHALAVLHDDADDAAEVAAALRVRLSAP